MFEGRGRGALHYQIPSKKVYGGGYIREIVLVGYLPSTREGRKEEFLENPPKTKKTKDFCPTLPGVRLITIIIYDQVVNFLDDNDTRPESRLVPSLIPR